MNLKTIRVELTPSEIQNILTIPMTPVLMVDGEIRHRCKWLPNKEKILKMLTTAA